MGAPITSTKSWLHDDIHMIIDVRSPSEFADDHIKGAVNLPVLSDAERAEIGTLYKQVSPFEARRKGAALVSKNISHHLQTALKDMPSQFKPLIHCWRGGQRSQSFALICAEIGWPSYILDGGYKAYRAAVMESLDQDYTDFDIRVISGPTGSAKTRLLHHIHQQGGQILDLEGLAAHRGSLLGADPHQAQPSQRMFETNLFNALSALDLHKPVYVEAESAKIGMVQIPKMLWRNMCAAPAISLSIPVESRITYLLEDYKHLFETPEIFETLIYGMQNRHSHKITTRWRDALHQKDWLQLAGLLLEDHYDPAYYQSANRHNRPNVWQLDLVDCSEASLNHAAHKILHDKNWSHS